MKPLRWLTRFLTLRTAAMLTLVALALMVWSVLDPTVLPVMVAMTIGQVIGTAAFVAYGWVVFHDLFKKRAERRSLQRIELAQQRSQQTDGSEPREARREKPQAPPRGEDVS